MNRLRIAADESKADKQASPKQPNEDVPKSQFHSGWAEARYHPATKQQSSAHE